MNWIKIEKDGDDFNIIASFSGRDEWETMRVIIEKAYVDKKEEEYTHDMRFRPHSLENIFNDICEMGDLIYHD